MNFLNKQAKNLREKSRQQLYVECKELAIFKAEKEQFTDDEIILKVYSKYKQELPRIILSRKMLIYRGNIFGKNSGFFNVWMARRYPTFLKLYIGHERFRKEYLWLEEYSFKTIIQYLPIFILRQLDTYLKDKRLVMLVKHLMEGKNIRTYNDLPYPLSKKAAHHFHNLTFGGNLERNYYRCLVYGLGGSVLLFEVMKNYWIPSTDGHLAKIKVIVPFFAKYTELDAPLLRSLLGYVNHMLQEVENYELKGRTLQSLRRASDAYYEEMNRIQEENSRYHSRPKPESWEGAQYSGWENQDGYKIIQLKTSAELNYESAKMHHCVKTYAYSCDLSLCSIWSLRYVDEKEKEHILVTIEVNQEGCIIQAKAPYNQTPEEDYMKMIGKWMKAEKLKIEAYV